MKWSILTTVAFCMVLFLSCDKGVSIAPPQDVSNQSSDIIFRIDTESAPTGITQVVATLSRRGFDTLRTQLMIGDESAQGIFRNVSAGIWHLRVDALDTSLTVLYSGQTAIEVLPGRTVEVRLTLEPATGDVAIDVFWGITRAGNALLLDGVDDFIEVPNSPSLSGIQSAITLEAWVKPQQQYYNTVVSKGSSNYTIEFAQGLYPGFMFKGLAIDYAGATNYWGRLLLFNSLPENTWTHLAVTYKVGVGIRVYVNGQLVYSTSASGFIDPGASALRIGARVDDIYTEYFKGEIDELRIWNLARSQTEISSAMRNQLSGVESGLVAFWKFDEARGSIVAEDASPNCNHGIVRGHATFVTSRAF